MPAISVIVPCYNQEKYIAECLDSVLAQTFTDFEVIVVNDGSTDNSLEIIKKYAEKYPRIKLINQENQGIVATRNIAISQASGTYIYPLDGDDKIAPQCLEKLYQMRKHGDVIYSETCFFGDKTGIFKLLPPTQENMIHCNQVVCSALYKKDDWVLYKGYDSEMQNGWEDWEFWLNFVEDNKIFYKVDEILFCYRIKPETRNSCISKENKYELLKYIHHKHRRLLPKCNFLYKKKIKKNRCYYKVFGITVYKKHL